MAPRRELPGDDQFADVLMYQGKRTTTLIKESKELSEALPEYEDCLRAQGIDIDLSADSEETECHPLAQIPSWDECVEIARREVGIGRKLDDLFTDEEVGEINQELRSLREEYGSLHRLDPVDIAISVSAGLVSAVASIVLVGIPERTPEGLRGKSLENYVRDWFKRKFPLEEMERLARDVSSKVPYDAPYNTNFTEKYVEGLWPTMHRLYSLGHDPLLGFIIGTLDILSGRMTTIDKFGKIAVQEIPRYTDRKEDALFAALCKQVIHFKTDVNTSMGLPAPLLGLFNLMQFGSIGEENQTIAEMVQGMYYEGYDFQHFCAQSISVMLAEVVVRLGYFLKRIKEGDPIRQAVPVTTNREKHPKLGTMLFTAHSIATAVNAGKVAFTKNPMEINYPQWIAFAVYSFKQAKWVLVTRPEKQHGYVMDSLEAEMAKLGAPKASEALVLGS